MKTVAQRKSFSVGTWGSLEEPVDITDITVDLGLISTFQTGGSCIWKDHMWNGSGASRSSLMSIWKDRLTKLWWRICCSHSKDPKPVGTGYEFASCWGYTGTCASVFTHKCWWPAPLESRRRKGCFPLWKEGKFNTNSTPRLRNLLL